MTRKAAKPAFRTPDWSTYNRQKKLVFNVLVGYLPIGAICYVAIKLYPNYSTAGYAVFCLYMFYWTFVFLNYLSAPCAACGALLSGSQLYSKTCMKCGAKINPPA